ncbi:MULTISPECIES: TraH family protein [Rhizobium/Agrobacterium group]|uniref:TraH family protein n=1 Tax=Rhizobium/Agrobacterium group TaxID=227290 RepID=UPI0003F1D51D|nr:MULTISPECIES: TraH family protein [Rhizobium/Agrobacterium group]AHK04910.1 conjugal transfer protein TraH [Agrobacterium tumefaciens LBA4213 (Ach5)]AKC10639.1 conjugal transfer protein TraH [Agrobacterium tumefaciens]AYM20022.1 conjugal transfer protein TraH [Agrobacterium tumefaciens]AYM71325.1 conjugal transfer protein TraH [Agrobacterium tumefaciens]NIB59714.1 conjugal transfer protein TraH [Agrobacterium tumefaciens]
MLDAALIQQCADPSMKPAIVEQFIARAGSQDPLAITVRSGNRVVLVPKPTTPEEALALIRDNLGRNTVRVGITQYPAGLGIVEAGQLKPEMIEACENIRMGTALFAKVFRIVLKWYGNPTAKEVMPQVMDDAVIAWQTGYFEGVAVFRAEEPAQEKITRPAPADSEEPENGADPNQKDNAAANASDTGASDPNKAGIRVDLSGIGARP